MVDSTVRAMTWNIWWRFGPRWRDRQPGLLATLERVGPDVLALQEVWAGNGTTQADELATALGMHAVFAAPSYPAVPADPDSAGLELGVAVLSRWPILDHCVHALPARHRSWDPVALAVRIEHPTGPLPVVATCLEHGIPYTDDRIAQGTFVADLATDPRFDGP
jgi:endonuclease/exonuclease/phosphatase family metal-dependent hydrolase